MKIKFVFLGLILVFISAPAISGTVSIDFETLTSGDMLRDQFVELGLRVTGDGAFSGLVIAEPDYGHENYGNSPTHVIHIGHQNEPTTLQFVDPSNPEIIVGATQFSMLFGDGDPLGETGEVAFFDIDGNALGSPNQFTTTTGGHLIAETSATLGSEIGSVRLTQMPSSASGMGGDDLKFALAPIACECVIGGNVSGLAGSGLVLQNSGGDDLPITADGPFTFATPLTNGSTYDVTVLTQPSSPNQTCTVSNGSGTVPGADVTDVFVSCLTETFTIGGNVSGLVGSGLVLQNNGGDDLDISADGNFVFATDLEDESAYIVSVLIQPSNPNQICAVFNSSGTVSGADVTNVTVICGANYVALGDSFASGEGIGPPYLGGACHRSDLAYANTVNLPYPIDGSDLVACSGATSDAIWLNSFEGEPPQIKNPALVENTSHISVSIGGNDAGFKEVLEFCAWHTYCMAKEHFSGGTYFDFYENEIQTTVRQNIITTIEALKFAHPGAEMTMIGYPYLFAGGAQNVCAENLGFGESERESIRALTFGMNSMLKNVANARGLHFVSVTQAFAGHEVCGDKVQWLNSIYEPRRLRILQKVEWFHPTLMGHTYGYRPGVQQWINNTALKPTTTELRVETSHKKLKHIALTTDPVPTVGRLEIFLESVQECESPGIAAGQSIRISGSGFEPSATVTLTWTVEEDVDVELGEIAADTNGDLEFIFQVPADTPTTPIAFFQAIGTGSNGELRGLSGSINVLPQLTVDGDLDGIPDACDLCPEDPDPGQEDADSDLIGDSCDICPGDAYNDADSDGLCAAEDECPLDGFNDADSNGICADNEPVPIFRDSFEGSSL